MFTFILHTLNLGGLTRHKQEVRTYLMDYRFEQRPLGGETRLVVIGKTVVSKYLLLSKRQAGDSGVMEEDIRRVICIRFSVDLDVGINDVVERPRLRRRGQR